MSFEPRHFLYVIIAAFAMSGCAKTSELEIAPTVVAAPPLSITVSSLPTQATTTPTDFSTVNQIFAGSSSDSTMYLTESGDLYIEYGSSLYSIRVGETVSSATTGPNHYLVCTSEGHVYAWGDNHVGQLGIEDIETSEQPLLVPGLENVISVATGLDFSVALLGDGSVWTWGDNSKGQLGETTETEYRTNPMPVYGVSNIVAISAGQSHVLALSEAGSVYSWGLNDQGQLGRPTNNSSALLGQVAIENIEMISAGAEHSIALNADGVIWGWGDNSHGQLGVETDLDNNTPIMIQVPASDIVGISTGQNSSYAITLNGSIWVWGDNRVGQLGLGDSDHNQGITPTEIPNLSDVVSVVGGRYHTIALKRNGILWGWGDPLFLPVEFNPQASIQWLPIELSIQARVAD